MTRYLLILLLLTGCNTPPPDRPYATGSVTNKASSGELQTRNLHGLSRTGRVFTNFNEMYRYYTNNMHDRIVEDYAIPLLNVHTNTLTNIHWSTNIYITISNTVKGVIGPPAVPGYGPMPVIPQTAVSNWMTPKAMGILPKPMMTNQIPGSVILTKITTTDKDGKLFTAELELNGEQTIRAGSKMAVVIFALAHTNYTVQVCTNIADGKWTPFSSGVSQDTNGAIVIVDLHEGTSPLKFYRQVETK